MTDAALSLSLNKAFGHHGHRQLDGRRDAPSSDDRSAPKFAVLAKILLLKVANGLLGVAFTVLNQADKRALAQNFVKGQRCFYGKQCLPNTVH